MPKADRVLGLFASAPRYESFYTLFERAGANVKRATELLARLVADWPDDGTRLRFELKELETQGDRITHDVIQHLNVKAATPFSAADAHELISELDDVVDLAEEVADFMGLYRIEVATEQAIALASVLERAGSELATALTRLRRPADLRPHIVALQELEHEGDGLEREALSSLFDGGIDPMVVVRWKDIYERLEEAIDACRHAGNTLESLIVKSS
ncbi:MAG TPA: DUF47 family protein [Thermoleophilaceae bacterium]|jgi:uncharacterized protein Yka (UPF0111/DUF47 family)|nr:DUF47 family protein [Thermoleophilaceae bacterium]